MKILTVIGARPQFVKAAMVSRQLANEPGVSELLIHTGQHYDPNMSDVFFEELGLPAPTHHLGIGSGSHGRQTGEMLSAIEDVILAEQPDWALVYGDTNSTLAGALAAAKLHVPVAHVEAGLRSFNRRMPEEVNRILTDHASDLLFTPSTKAEANLRQEGVPADRIEPVGDVMYDAALFFGERAEAESNVLERLSLTADEFILATVHRAENTDEPARLQAIADGLTKVASDVPVVLPLHPRTVQALLKNGIEFPRRCGVRVVEPVGYLDMVMLERMARVIVTDSGGVQKEAFFHKTPCVTLRDETEWVELVEQGWNRLVPPSSGAEIARAVFDAMALRVDPLKSPYGQGDTAQRIVARLATR